MQNSTNLARSISTPARDANLLAAGSVVSYPTRGPWGRSGWRGNTSGHIIKDWLQLTGARYCVDPAKGSDTTGDVCRDLGVQYTGLDLHEGFNLLRHSLKRTLRQKAPSAGLPDAIFFHPPYDGMIRYSRDVWGGGVPHPDDLSENSSHEEFMFKMQNALLNIYDALQVEGQYGVLIGDWRQQGEYHSYQADVINLGIGRLKNVIIKQQHNMVSNRTQYSGRFIPITHEYFLVFVKDRRIASIGQLMVDRAKKMTREWYGSWENVVTAAVREIGGRAKVDDVYQWVFNNVVDDGRNKNVEAKIRQVLQLKFSKCAPATYELPAAA